MSVLSKTLSVDKDLRGLGFTRMWNEICEPAGETWRSAEAITQPAARSRKRSLDDRESGHSKESAVQSGF